MKQLMETAIPENYVRGLDTENNVELGATHTDKVADILFTVVSNILKLAKSDKQPTVFKFENLGDFIAGGIVTYHANDEADKPGNWSYVWTFDKEDVPENAKVISITDPEIYPQFTGYAGNKWRIGFINRETMILMMNYLLQTIKNYLISNATLEEETAVELEGVFQARSIVEENGEVVCSIEVVGETKAIIKSDEDIEK